MRPVAVLLGVSVAACSGGGDSAGSGSAAGSGARGSAHRGSGHRGSGSGSASLPEAASYPDLAAALVATIPADARVVGFGELHNRTDRTSVTSALSRFTAALPAFADKVSDLVVETWIVDPTCGSAAVVATTRVETAVSRPAATKSEVGALADAAHAAGIRPLAMQLSCDDYDKIAPAGKDVDYAAMLGLVTRELGRLARGAVAKPASARPWVAVYGGALHNDRFPEAGTEDWSYAASVDAATSNHFVEIDLMVPELAAADPASQRQPWFPLVGAADGRVHVWKRGERSFVAVLDKTARPGP
jgi:hypothetical protein